MAPLCIYCHRTTTAGVCVPCDVTNEIANIISYSLYTQEYKSRQVAEKIVDHLTNTGIFPKPDDPED